MKHKTLVQTGLALVAVLVLATPSPAQGSWIEQIDTILAGRTADCLAEQAAEIGEAVLPETFGYSLVGDVLVVGTRLARSESFSLDDLATGVALEWILYDAGNGIPTGYYTYEIEMHEPTQISSPSTHTLVSKDGAATGKAEGQISLFGTIPDPATVLSPKCETSSYAGEDDDGETCVVFETVCVDGATSIHLESCLQPSL